MIILYRVAWGWIWYCRKHRIVAVNWLVLIARSNCEVESHMITILYRAAWEWIWYCRKYDIIASFDQSVKLNYI
jgi:hypothetical protein